jgi:hypothetical protein
MADPESRRRIGHANRLKAEQDFDQAAMFAAHAALWRGTSAPALGRGTPPPP